MSSTKICVDNQEIIRRFENGTIPAKIFHHADHVRLAFAYLCEYPSSRRCKSFAAR